MNTTTKRSFLTGVGVAVLLVLVTILPFALSGGVTEAQVPPLPIITSIQPSSGEQGQTIELTVSGENFVPAVEVSFAPPAGTTITTVRVINPMQLTVTIAIDINALIGPRDVTVTNPDGRSGTSRGGFTVKPALSPPPLLPVITSIQPLSVEQGQTIELTVSGQNFVEGATVAFTPSTGVTVSSVRFVSSTALRATMTIAKDASTGARDVTVTNPDGLSVTSKGGFIVSAAPLPPLSPPKGGVPTGVIVTIIVVILVGGGLVWRFVVRRPAPTFEHIEPIFMPTEEGETLGCTSTKQKGEIDKCTSDIQQSHCTSTKQKEEIDKCTTDIQKSHCTSTKQKEEIDKCTSDIQKSHCTSTKQKGEIDKCTTDIQKSYCTSSKQKGEIDKCTSDIQQSHCTSSKQKGEIDKCTSDIQKTHCTSTKQKGEIDKCTSDIQQSHCTSTKQKGEIDQCTSDIQKTHCTSTKQKGEIDKCTSDMQKAGSAKCPLCHTSLPTGTAVCPNCSHDIKVREAGQPWWWPTR